VAAIAQYCAAQHVARYDQVGSTGGHLLLAGEFAPNLVWVLISLWWKWVRRRRSQAGPQLPIWRPQIYLPPPPPWADNWDLPLRGGAQTTMASRSPPLSAAWQTTLLGQALLSLNILIVSSSLPQLEPPARNRSSVSLGLPEPSRKWRARVNFGSSLELASTLTRAKV